MNQKLFYWICMFVLFLIVIAWIWKLNVIKSWGDCNGNISWWLYELYSEKAKCIESKSKLIIDGNNQYQNRNDELLSWTKKEIENINTELSKIDISIANNIPRAFR